MRKVLIIISVIVVCLVLAKGTLELSSSRTFQFYGNLVPRVETDEKVVALTFDDGPTENTAAILAILAELDVKATFFLTGNELEKNPGQGKMIAEAGHEIGNHTYSHSRMVFKTPGTIRQEIDRTNELIRETGYNGTIHFRPPYGKKLLFLPRYLKSQEMQTIMWNLEPDSYPDMNATAMTSHVSEKVQPGSIILLHVMYESRTESVKAVTDIVTQLRSQGYEFKTISELLEFEAE